MSSDPWLDELKALLCALYELWGGDCDDLKDDDPQQWHDLVCQEFDANGAPSQGFGTKVDELETHLASFSNCLDPSVDTAYDTLVADLQAASQ